MKKPAGIWSDSGSGKHTAVCKAARKTARTVPRPATAKRPATRSKTKPSVVAFRRTRNFSGAMTGRWPKPQSTQPKCRHNRRRRKNAGNKCWCRARGLVCRPQRSDPMPRRVPPRPNNCRRCRHPEQIPSCFSACPFGSRTVPQTLPAFLPWAKLGGPGSVVAPSCPRPARFRRCR